MKPEILSPAGNPEKAEAALRFGADALYLAGRAFGMRAGAGNFTDDEMQKTIKAAHAVGAKVYVTVNTMPREYEFAALRTYLKRLGEIGPDALIISDLGVMAEAARLLPGMPLHVSTQASCVNAASLAVWQQLGACRVVLARELSLDEIVAIRRAAPPELELEVFVHGSMCVSWSGRCLLSNYLTGRDGNRGECAQPCRWNYTAHNWGLVEEKRPDTLMPIEEDGGETFIMSSKDLCMIEHMDELCAAGIHSFKIEGRMKSAYYTAVVTNAYRMARDAALAGEAFDPRLKREVESVSHRTYGTGYFYSDSHREANVSEQSGYIREKAYLATVLSYDGETGEALCIQRNKYTLGEALEVVSPGCVGRPLAPSALFDEAHTPIISAPHPGMKFYMRLDSPVQAGDILRGN